MTDYDPSAYGQALSAEYDRLYPEENLETAAAVGKLADLASSGGKSLVEFGVGTGRLALPLLEHGVRVAGIDGSQEMLEQLRAKPKGAEVEVVTGDFTAARVEGSFSVAILVFNAIFGLPNRDAQIACFGNALRHLAPGGCFVLETYVLRPEQLSGGWSIVPRTVAHEHVELQLSRYDAVAHRMERTLVHVQTGGTRFVTVTDNYAWPGELDLMAKVAGLKLRSRHGDWSDGPFDASSHKHISVYEPLERA